MEVGLIAYAVKPVELLVRDDSSGGNGSSLVGKVSLRVLIRS